jgi:hypothetical protein
MVLPSGRCRSRIFARSSKLRDGRPRHTTSSPGARVATHDLGLAAANLTFEATSRGIMVHQMVGILPGRAGEVYEIPEGFRALTGLAVGYPSNPSGLSDKLQQRDQPQRRGKPLQEFVFESKWGSPSPLVD